MKKKGIIAGSIAGIIILLLIIVCIGTAGNPRSLVEGALINTARDMSSVEFISYAKNLVNGGSVTLNGNLEPLSGKDANAELKVYTDFSRMRFAAYGKIKEGRDTVASFRGAFNGKDLSLESPQISKKPYGVSLKKLQRNLPGSIFDPENSGEKVELDKNLYEYLLKLDKTVSGNKDLSKEYSRLLNKYERLLVTSLMDNARISSSSDRITASGQQLNCNVVTLDFDRKSLAEAVSQFVTAAKHDRDLESFLLKSFSNVDFGIKDADDMVDDFYDRLDNFKRSVKDYDGDMTVWIYITKSGKRIARIDVDTDGRNSSGSRIAYEMSLELGKNVKTTEEISFSFKSSEGDKIDLSYSVRQNDKTAYKASFGLSYDLKHSGGKKSASSVSFKWDKKAGGFTLTGDANGDVLVIEGKLQRKGGTYVLSLQNLETSGKFKKVSEKFSSPVADYKITVTFDSVDRSFNPSRYVEITKMDYSDFQGLKDDSKKTFEDIRDTWFKK
ncbi:MAG: hypothetical protein IKW88_07155 [Clostridiales bacterium]|nr:hypothetical protein [Clostridiales bacterium]